jgi:hypothetical protein
VSTDLRSPRAKLVYLALTTWGPASLDELHERLDEPRLALLGVLDVLQDRGVVTDANGGYAPA